MKHLTRLLQTIIALATIFALPHMAFAIRQVTSVTPTPSSASVTAGLATNVTANVVVISGSGASTRYLGLATNTTFVTPAEPTITATLDPTFFIFPTANTTSNMTLTVNTTAATPAGSYIVSIVVGTNPPNANVVSVTNTFTLNVGAVFMPQKIWSPAGANTNWSTAGNWAASGVPTPSNDVLFVDLGVVGSAGLVDNVVDASLLIGSLTYGQTNNYHTTLIAAGQTLAVGGDANGLNTGTGTDPGDGQLVTAAITGAGGTLAVTNKSANVNVGQAHATTANAVSQSKATLDLSGLDKFTATISRLLVGVDTAVLKGACGVLNLAKTNTITATVGSTAPQIDVGDNTQANGTPTIQSILSLGQTNGIFADSVAVGRGKTDNNGALMNFNSAFGSPSAVFRGTNGAASRVGTWFIGDGYGARTYYTYGTCDFSLGAVNALVDTMYVGRGAQVAFGAGANNPGTGTLTFGAGTVDINTLEVGYSTANASGTGTVNVNGGTLLVNTLLELAHVAGSSGTLNISNGTVTANSGITSGGGTASINQTGGTLNLTNATATVGTTASPLNSFNVTNATINLAVQSLVPSIATVNLSADGAANTINIKSVPMLTGFPTQFPLIQYGLNGGSASGNLATFTLGTLPSASPAYGAYISNNVANNSIDIVFTNGPFVPALTWDGTPTGNWDTTTTNWKPKTGPNTAYAQGNFVTFDESLAGTPNVNLTTALTPGSITVSNAATSYAFSGAGSLSGIAALVKNGSGTLTLSETGGDNFSGGVIVNNGTVILNNASAAISGGTTINGGTVQVGNNSTSGSLPAGNVVDSGELIFNRAGDITVTNAISSSGLITQNGTNVVSLSGNSSFAGTATVAKGTLLVGSTNGLGLATSVTVSNGASFDVGGIALFGNGNSALSVTVSGAGAGDNGAIINSGGNVSRTLHTVTLAADATFGGHGDWDIRNTTGSSAPADATLNGAFNLTKVGTNTVTFRGVTIDGGLGDINVQAGSMTITATATAPQTSLGNASATVTVNSNATLTLDSIGNVPDKNYTLTNGGTLKSSGTNTLGSSSLIALTGDTKNAITVNSAAQFTINSVISGPGGFTKNGANQLILTAATTYGGGTVVSGGTLALTGSATINSSTNININSGATLDVSGRTDGTFTLLNGQTLNGGIGGGPGLINGVLIASPGSVISPGGVGTTNLGAISISSNATLQGITSLKLDPSNGTNGWIGAYGIAYGGSLIVTNVSSAFTNGQTFQLFVAANGIYNVGTLSSVTLPTVPGVTWTTNLAVNGTITATVVSVIPPSPTITHIGLTGTDLHLNGTNGAPGGTFYVVASTNLTVPLTNWPAISTNAFTGSGTFNVTVTNAVNPDVPQTFYSVKQTY